MTIFSWEELQSSFFFHDTAVTIGGFDGPHLGHFLLCKAVLDEAKEKKIKAGIITFSSSPRRFKEDARYAGDLSTLRLKIQTFESWGFDFVVVIDFSVNFSKIEGRIFFDYLVEHCKMKYLVLGSDFKCGRNREMGIAEIQEYVGQKDIFLFSFPLVRENKMSISSSEIRKHILNGHLENAVKLLGHNYFLDVGSLHWTVGQHKKTELFCTDISSISQIVPPVGMYRVEVIYYELKETFLSEIKVITFLERGLSFLRLEVPVNARLDKIGFYADKIE